MWKEGQLINTHLAQVCVWEALADPVWRREDGCQLRTRVYAWEALGAWQRELEVAAEYLVLHSLQSSQETHNSEALTSNTF